MEEIELSYRGEKDGAKYRVPVGTQRFNIPDPTAKRRAEFIENPTLSSVSDLKVLEFVRRPHSNVFVLDPIHHQMKTTHNGDPSCACGYMGKTQTQLQAAMAVQRHIKREHKSVG